MEMIWLKYIVPLLLWTSCNSQNVCQEPPEIDFGEIVSDEKAEYQDGDSVQYRCVLGYALEGPEWITCKGQDWTPAPKCLAPCIITRRQLQAKNLFLSGSQRRSLAIQNNQTLEFQCREGYVLSTPSIRKCIDGHMNLPSCISERGKNCSRSPTIENGEITTLPQKQYTSGSSVEFKCNQYYAMEGNSRSFCDNGNWTEVPVCLEIVCSRPTVDNGRVNPHQQQYSYEETIQIVCDPGYEPERQATSRCTENGWIPQPKCVNSKMNCSHPPAIQNGDVLNPFQVDYPEGTVLQYKCQNLYLMNGSAEVRCINGLWTETPTCIEACTISEEDMAHNNIQLKWRNAQKLYSSSGDVIEFECRWSYQKDPSSPSFRAYCINGRVEYPRCITDY